MPFSRTIGKDVSVYTLFILMVLSSSVIFFFPHSSVQSEGSFSIPSTRSTDGSVYYIDISAGNDSNDGLSPTQGEPGNGPWKTLDNLDLSTDFRPGDEIRLKAGQEWDLRECEDRFLQIRSSGARGKPLMISSYGSGGYPCLNGFYPLSGDLSGDTVEINGDFVTFRGIEIKNTWSFGMVSQSIRSEHHGVIIEDCYIHDTGRDGIYTPFGEYELTIRNNVIANTGLRAGGAGIAIMGDGSYHGNDIEISHNRIIRPQGDGITLHEGSSTAETHLGSRISIHHNEVNGSLNGDAIDLTTGSHVFVHDNVLYDCNNQLIHVDSSFRDGYIYNNVLWGDAGTGLSYIAVSDISFFNNLVMVNGGVTPYCLNVNSDNYHGFPVDNITIYRNTFVFDETMTHPGLIEIADELGTLGKISMISNIFTTKADRPADILIHFQFNSYLADARDFSCNGNIYGPGDFIVRDRDYDVEWSEWRSDYGYDGNGENTDPKMIWETDTEYRLKQDSPCIDSGLDGNLPDYVKRTIPVYDEDDVGSVEFSPEFDITREPVRLVAGTDAEIYEDGRYDTDTGGGSKSSIFLSLEPVDGWDLEEYPSERSFELDILSVKIENGFHFRWEEKDLEPGREFTYKLEGFFPFTKCNLVVDGEMVGEFTSTEDGTIYFKRNSTEGKRTLELISNMILIKEDLSDPNATTGEVYDFLVSIGENGKENQYFVEYWFGSTSSAEKTSMKLKDREEDLTLGESTDIPSSTPGPLFYNFMIIDDQSRTYRSLVREVMIIDNDMPVVKGRSVERSSEDIGFLVSVNAKDNIGIQEARLEYVMGQRVYNITMNRSGDDYQALIPIDEAGRFEYIVWITDSSSNTLKYGPFILEEDEDVEKGFLGIRKDSWMARNIAYFIIIFVLIIVIISLLFTLFLQKHKYEKLIQEREYCSKY